MNLTLIKARFNWENAKLATLIVSLNFNGTQTNELSYNGTQSMKLHYGTLKWDVIRSFNLVNRSTDSSPNRSIQLYSGTNNLKSVFGLREVE